jgi:hypothetical protein
MHQLDRRAPERAARYRVVPPTTGYVQQVERCGIYRAAGELDYPVDTAPGTRDEGHSVARRSHERIKGGIVAAAEPKSLSVAAPARRSPGSTRSDHKARTRAALQNRRIA